VAYPDIIPKVMNIPSSQKIVVAVSTGYPDEEDIINQGVTDRLALDDRVSWHGIP